MLILRGPFVDPIEPLNLAHECPTADEAVQPEFQQAIAPIRQKADSLLLRGHGTDVDGMCRELFSHRELMWTFLEVQGVEPTNNAAERSLRHPVIWRKLSFGTQGEQGSRFAETMLTTIETFRQQNRSVIDHATHSVQNHSS